MGRHDCIFDSVSFIKIELGASILHISVIFLLDLGTVLTVCMSVVVFGFIVLHLLHAVMEIFIRRKVV